MSDCAAAMPENDSEGAQRVSRDGRPATDDSTPKPPWYVLQVRPRYENLVCDLLQQKEVEVYLPLYSTKQKWSERNVETQHPLFPGYVFCRLDYTRRLLPILTTPGVLRVLGVGRTATPVDEQELEAVRLVLESGRAACPGPMPRVGDLVRIEYGPLAGVEGVMVGQKKRRHLVVSITLLQRSVSVEIEDEWARRISAPVPQKSCVSVCTPQYPSSDGLWDRMATERKTCA
jgi:transcription antitermination factor NusG